jgi:membrane-bound lytic murein transglycosylase D
MDLPYWNLPDSVRSYGGITISPDIDERFHATKSTIVFSEYLNELYDEYEDWNLVMIAYFI